MTDFTQHSNFRNNFDIKSLVVESAYRGVIDDDRLDKMLSEIKKERNANLRVSNCCGAPVDYDSDICSDCKEHCAIEETCPECYGTGTVDVLDTSKSMEMRIDPPIKTITCEKCNGEGWIEVDE